jgi:uncharacterized protein (DUF58 family)
MKFICLFFDKSHHMWHKLCTLLFHKPTNNIEQESGKMKTLIKASASIITVAATLVAGAAQAATTATLGLQGSISTVLEVTSAALPAATALDLSVNNDVAVADIFSKANVNYKLTFESANLGQLKHEDDSKTDAVSYNLQFNGSTFALDSAATFNLNKTDVSGETRSLRINTNASFGYAGNYTDTVTVTIAVL